MADDRPAEEVPDAIGNLRRELEDLKTSLAYNMTRRPVGSIEPVLLNVAKPGSLLLHGQTLSRTTYANLWQWITENGLSPSVFGVGDGSTTFVLPDLRGKAAVGATVVDPLGKSFGSASVNLTAAMLPSHSHTVGSVGDHAHAISNNGGGHAHATSGGSHGGHFPGSSYTAAAGNDYGLAAWNSGGSSGGSSHGHSMSAEQVAHTLRMSEEGGHSHTISGPTGTQTPLFLVQPSYAINWVIWT